MDIETGEIGDAESTKEKEEDNENEPDMPPEYCHYRDEGCELAPSCLSCPFPRCLYDEPGGKQHWLKELRNEEIARLFRNEGWEVKELSQMFGLSRRTIQRALKSTLSILSSPRGGDSNGKVEIS